MPTFIWRNYANGYEDEGFIVVNARNEEEAREKFWAEYKRDFEEWRVDYEAYHQGRVQGANKEYLAALKRSYRGRDESWKDWKRQASTIENPPHKILLDDEVYWYGDFNEGGTGIKRFKDET